MADRELKKLNRRELLKMLLVQCEETERLKQESDDIREQYEVMAESYERLKKKLDLKDARLNQKDEKITEGLVASDEEGAAVRYRVKETVVPTKKTDVGQMSASATLKKAKVEVVPDIDTVAASASASLRKEGKSQAVVLRPAAKQRAVMETASEVPKPAVVSREESSLMTSTPVSTLVPQVPEGAITSASVAKVGKLEKARRKMRGMGKKSSNPQKGEQ